MKKADVPVVQLPPISVLKERGLWVTPLLVTTTFKTPSFFTDINGIRRRKKYL